MKQTLKYKGYYFYLKKEKNKGNENFSLLNIEMYNKDKESIGFISLMYVDKRKLNELSQDFYKYLYYIKDIDIINNTNYEYQNFVLKNLYRNMSPNNEIRDILNNRNSKSIKEQNNILIHHMKDSYEYIYYKHFIKKYNNSMKVNMIKINDKFRGNNLSIILYELSAKILSTMDYNLIASQSQIPEAKSNWEKMKSMGYPIIEEEFILYKNIKDKLTIFDYNVLKNKNYKDIVYENGKTFRL